MNGEDNELVARATRVLVERTSHTVGREFFMALARAIAETLGTRSGLVGEVVEAGKIRTLAVWDRDRYLDNFDYTLAGTPCADVVTGDVCHYQSDVARLFPDDQMLADMGIESYLGVPIASQGEGPVGLLVALHDAPMAPVPELEGVFALFADRCAAELGRARSEAELRRSEARYRQIVSTCVEGVWLVDASGITTLVNQQMAAMLGYTEAEMLGRPLFDFMDDAGRADTHNNLSRRAEGIAEHHESRLVHKDGRDVFTIMATNPMYDDAGRFDGALALVTDITERRRLEANARQSQRLESLGVLAGGVAHDFNNLLVGILGNADIALEDSAPPRAALEDIRTAALRAAELTRQLLAFSGKGKFLLSPIDLNTIIADMGRLLPTVISKKTRLVVLPSVEPLMINADAGQISQVVMNLIVNASEALGDEPGTVTVTTSAVRADAAWLLPFPDPTLAPGRYVCLTVADDGCGMDTPTQAKIFDPFFTTKFTGRGLGLAVLLGVLRGHRGAVRVTSQSGEGTTFTVILPEGDPALHAAGAPGAPEAAPARAGRTILVADDEALIRGVVRRVLMGEGWRVIEAADGPEAVASFTAHADEIDLVLLDLTMPGLSGEQVFHELRRVRPNARVLLSSGYSEDDVASRLGASPTGFLPKPWTARSLVAAIRAAIDR